ncbi:MAG TPA: lysogenization regulator HflD [Mizugakiibacter sp.]|nr:lysogenization regulator HflD [Mizugakiibacter sp.]
MNEELVVALAGLFQGTTLVRELATQGRCDPVVLERSLASVLRIDAASTADVYGGLEGVQRGLEVLLAQLDQSNPDPAMTRIVLTIMRIERRLMGHHGMLQHLQEGLRGAQRQADHFGSPAHPAVIARLAGLYVETVSTLRPRVLVSGHPTYLNQPSVVERIRAALLATVRSSVLWHQLGGRQWRLLLYRRRACMLARGMLTQQKLDRG